MANIKRANASGITKSGTAISDVPDAPTIGAVSDLGTGSTASVAYTAATTGGAATTFTATSSPGGFTGTGSSPITVSGLTAGTAYTFTVTASNSTGSSPASSASSSLTLASVGAFESIASATATGGQTVISFTSIPGTYKSLQIRGLYRDTVSATGVQSIILQFNSDTGTNYVWHRIEAGGTSVTASAATTQNYALLSDVGVGNSAAASTFGSSITNVIDYASTSKNKTIQGFGGTELNSSTGSVGYVSFYSGLWLSTSAITSIQLKPGNTAFVAGTTFALYGIKGS